MGQGASSRPEGSETEVGLQTPVTASSCPAVIVLAGILPTTAKSCALLFQKASRVISLSVFGLCLCAQGGADHFFQL